MRVTVKGRVRLRVTLSALIRFGIVCIDDAQSDVIGGSSSGLFYWCGVDLNRNCGVSYQAYTREYQYGSV